MAAAAAADTCVLFVLRPVLMFAFRVPQLFYLDLDRWSHIVIPVLTRSSVFQGYGFPRFTLWYDLLGRLYVLMVFIVCITRLLI